MPAAHLQLFLMFMSCFSNVDRLRLLTCICYVQQSAADMHTTQHTLTADNVRMLRWKTVLPHMKRFLKKTLRFFKLALFGTIASQIAQFYEKQWMKK